MDTSDNVDPRVRRTQRDVVRAAGELLIEGGWTAVTHAAVAERAGYSKATLYNHWTGATDLGRDAFGLVSGMAHHEQTGDLRTDLIGELTAFAEVLTTRRLARVLAALAERAPSDPDISQLLRSFDDDGSAAIRQILADHGYDGADAETLHEVLIGAMVYRVLLRQLDPTLEFITHIVDHELS